MKSESGKFSFKVPEGHAEEGKKIEKTFDYDVCENEADALAVMEAKKYNIVDMVNDIIKANARSNAYQNALAPYKPSEVSADDIKARMIRDYVRLGISEEVAKAQVESLLATK